MGRAGRLDGVGEALRGPSKARAMAPRISAISAIQGNGVCRRGAGGGRPARV